MKFPDSVYYGFANHLFVGVSAMKWVLIALVTVIVGVLLWKYGFIKEFLGPWAAWANWIGYFS